WIVFANEFARFLNYFDETNTIKGDWTPFFTSDISSVLGSIAIQDIDEYREQIKERFDFLKDDDNKADVTGLETKLNELFSAVLTLSKAMDEYYSKLPVTLTLKNTLLNLIQTKLSSSLNRLLGYYKAANSLNYLTSGSFNDWRILNKNVVDAGEIINVQGLSNNWYDAASFLNWNAYITSIAEDNSIFTSPLGADEYLRIEHAANHNLFSAIFDQFLFAYTKLVNDSFAELKKTLGNWDTHQPHYALFLSFLKLFKLAQQQQNKITKEHLDFYYREILHLKPQPAEPNHVHILAELAKQIDSYLLAAATQLKAGKDSKGKEVVYALDADTTFNKAKVVSLKSLYKANVDDTIKDPLTNTVIQNNEGRLFASPVANSEDGLGAELKSTNKEWHPYVHKEYEEAVLKKISMPVAEIGFAIASHYLYLTEGERNVFIRLVTGANTLLDGKHIECYLTTEKEWYKADSPVITATNSTKLSDNTTLCAQISFTLGGDVPAIVNYNAEVHGGTFNVNVPVLKVYLAQDDLSTYDYDTFKDITITKAEVRVEVGIDSIYTQKGLKNLLLSNDFGTIDSSKPFQAFGPQPTTGNRMVIGSREIFTKKNASINVNFEWKDVPPKREDVSYVELGDGNFPNITVKYLEGGVWQVLESSDELFENSGTDAVSSTRRMSLSGTTINNTIVDYEEEYTAYDIGSNKGFVAVQLTQSFGHKEYLDALTIYLINKANKVADSDNPKPVQPYTPTIQSLYLSYSAYTTNDLTSVDKTIFNNREIQFFHLYPFGEAEQHKYINQLNNSTENIFLLPQFKHQGKDQDGNPVTIDHIGEFYIGIENLQPQQAVNILFQMLEGTTDPLTSKPVDHIHWSYLSNNRWLDFEEQEISDATLELVQSGIISFAVPEEATTNNTLLQSGYIWVKASIAEAAGAICKLLTMDAQAAIATFKNNDNADDFLDTALAAGTVSKLKTPDAAVKKISQPYPSFGGRTKESKDNFYVRVSERLRHKARAITIWDYEHLILEAFPEIYRVKCLNHTSVEQASDGSEYINEVKPGNVLIITVPTLVNRNDANPLKPYTNQNTLTKIEEYLKQRTSCFVHVKARQPQFEEVRMSFFLKLYEQYKDFTFYANLLRDEITQYLTPWAYNNAEDIQFGGKIYKSSLINFIEERYYVDYITDVQMFQKISDTTGESGNLEVVTASTTKSILVSAPASKHMITEIKVNDEELVETCIDINAVRS
ncbi:MAG TPA: hypothetical protein VH396_09240, partial [Chitinophagaceae bacterium]